MKLAAKASASLDQRLSRQTGGGEKPPSPTPEDQAIMGIVLHDFEEINPFDSDAVKVEKENPTEVHYIESLNYEAHSDETLDKKHTIRHSTDMLETIDSDAPSRKKTSKVELKQKILERKINTKNKTLKMSEELHAYHLKTAERTLEMMEELHEHNLKIAKLNEKKLELEIEWLQK